MPTYRWYGACTAQLVVMANKLPNTYSEADRNWQWPEKTWFQERLNSIKAKEHEQRRRAGANSIKEPLNEPVSPLGHEQLKVD